MSWPTARAKLIETIDRPLLSWMGITNRPSDCRTPMVSVRIVAATIISSQAARLAAATSGFPVAITVPQVTYLMRSSYLP